MADRRFEEARSSLGILLAQGDSAVRLVIGLTSHLLRLGIALDQGKGALVEALPPYQKRFAGDLMRQARRWTLPQLDHALAGLLDVDRLLKASAHSQEHFLEAWLLGLIVQADAP